MSDRETSEDQTGETTEDQTGDHTGETTEGSESGQSREERLDALGAEIQEVRQRVEDPLEQGDRQFIESGEDGPVDDTIAPPG